MKSGMINRTSPFVDVIEMLSGSWNEYNIGVYHIVVTPFFTVITATLDAGSTELPFRFTLPVAGTLSHEDGSIDAVIIKPGQTAINAETPGLFQLQLFGDAARVTALLSS